MRTVEKVFVAVFLGVIAALCLALVILTAQLKTKVCDCFGNVPSPVSGAIIERALHENQIKIDSIRSDSLLSVGDAARKLQERYRRR